MTGQQAAGAGSRTMVNVGLLLWCSLVLFEFLVIAMLSGFPLVILFAGVLYWPVKDALAWPVLPAPGPDGDSAAGSAGPAPEEQAQ